MKTIGDVVAHWLEMWWLIGSAPEFWGRGPEFASVISHNVLCIINLPQKQKKIFKNHKNSILPVFIYHYPVKFLF